MIDLHCHILPGVDDGPATLDEALDMARLAVEDGISTVIATPHLDAICGLDIQSEVERFNAALQHYTIALTVLRGCECRYHAELLSHGYPLLPGGRYVLVEFSEPVIAQPCFDLLYEMMCEQVVPIIAHPERNLHFQRHARVLEELVGDGCKLQVTAGSLLGEFGQEPRLFARYLLRKGWVSFLASDAHSNRFRLPQLSQAVRCAERLIGTERAHKLVRDNPRAVIDGRILAT